VATDLSGDCRCNSSLLHTLFLDAVARKNYIKIGLNVCQSSNKNRGGTVLYPQCKVVVGYNE